MVVRYCKQPNDFDCGPYALVNLEKWAGAQYNGHKKKLEYRKLMNTDREGTFEGMFMGTLMDSEYVYLACTTDATLRAINERIDAGYAITISYDQYNPKVPEKFEGHFTICVGRTKDYYILVNDERYNEHNKQAIVYRHRNTMKSMLKTANVWVVGKREEK